MSLKTDAAAPLADRFSSMTLGGAKPPSAASNDATNSVASTAGFRQIVPVDPVSDNPFLREKTASKIKQLSSDQLVDIVDTYLGVDDSETFRHKLFSTLTDVDSIHARKHRIASKNLLRDMQSILEKGAMEDDGYGSGLENEDPYRNPVAYHAILREQYSKYEEQFLGLPDDLQYELSRASPEELPQLIALLAERCPNLEQLDFSNLSAATGVVIEMLHQFENLQTVSFKANKRLKDDDFKALSKCTKLRWLKCENMPQIKGEFFKTLPEGLLYVSFKGCNIDPKNLADFPNPAKLVALEM